LPANRIIGRNEVRYPKQLSLTRGFDGQTLLQKESSHSAVARRIAGEVKALLDRDAENAGKLAILIRLYSQTAFLETASDQTMGNLPGQADYFTTGVFPARHGTRYQGLALGIHPAGLEYFPMQAINGVLVDNLKPVHNVNLYDSRSNSTHFWAKNKGPSVCGAG